MNIISLTRQTAMLPVQGTIFAVGIPMSAYQASKAAIREIANTVEQSRLLVARVSALLDAVEMLVAEIATTSARAAAVVTLSDAVAGEAAGAVRHTETLLDRTDALLDAYLPVLAAAQPVVSTAARVLQPRHVDAIATLLDLTPEVVDLITPALRGMGDIAPEIEDLAERFNAVGQIVEGIPGANLLRKRGADDSGSDHAREESASEPAAQ